ncbi:MAG: nucleotide exchange factor GrpE [Candidatus Binataceae bacterium]
MSRKHKDADAKFDGPPVGGEPQTGGARDNLSADAQSVDTGALSLILAQTEGELAEIKDKYLRALAETENVRKRLRHQSEENIRLQREAMLRELLPIVDNLERAVDAARGDGNGMPIVEGVEMVLHSMREFLRSHGVTPLLAVGQPFDPARHEAVDTVTSDVHPPNTVVDELHRGYQIGERILRPARVTVSLALPAVSAQRTDGEDGGSDVENG